MTLKSVTLRLQPMKVVSVFLLFGSVIERGMVIRRIVTQIPDVNELGLPSTLTDVIMAKRGLVLFVGGTGTGKSTSLAALLGYRNRNQRGHILTIEDPIEFVHEHRKSIHTQREVGLDTESFESALKARYVKHLM